jgi:thioesterase domain-containing protein
MNTYGPTEATVVATWFDASEPPVDETAAREVPLGEAVANVGVYVLDRHLQPVPLGCAGELYLGGLGLARGYLGRPALTAERFVPHPFGDRPGARLYRTGDLARRRADGTLEFLGRADQQVKLRGFRVEPGEVEAALGRLAGVAAGVVVVHPDAAGERRLVAYVVGRPGEPVDGGQVRRALATQLPEYMVPAVVVVLAALPLTPNGKVDRRALPPPDQLDVAARPAAEPRTPTERALVRLWENLLGIHPIGVADNFFDLGGHSLLAVRLLASVKAEFGRDLPLAVLLQEPTIERLARILDSAVGPAEWSPLVPIRPGGQKRPFYCLHPGGGNVLCYAGLARHLGADRPLIGIQASGLVDGQVIHESIEAMAADYVRAVRRYQPRGPYLLGGWSMGGVVAFAMAQELRRQGEEVDLLVLLDAPAMFTFHSGAADDPSSPADDAVLLVRFVQELTGPDHPEVHRHLANGAFARLGFDEQLHRVVQCVRAADLALSDLDEAQLGRLFRVFQVNARATTRYVPGLYPGRVVYFEASEPLPGAEHRHARAWGTVIDGLEVEATPGDHETMIGGHNVESLARSLQGWLDRADLRARQ